MRCPVHCPPGSSALRGPLRAVAVLAVLAVCVWAADALVSLWAAVLAAEAVLAAAGMWALQRRVRYWGWRKPVERVTARAGLVRAPYELPAPPLAIAAPKRYGASPGDVSAVTILAVVPGATEGERVKRWAGQ